MEKDIEVPSRWDDDEIIPACPSCEGDGCKACLYTGLTSEDCDFAGLARRIEGWNAQVEGLPPAG